MFENLFDSSLEGHFEIFSTLAALRGEVVRAARLMADSIGRGGKVLVCGNGGSAADAQHFAAELVGRFRKDRRAWPAIALTTDSSILTAVANDYGFDTVFTRQVEALGRDGDVFLGISTSGRSENVLGAAARARSIGMKTIGLLGSDGGRLAPIVDVAVTVGSSITARTQEAHIFVLHAWCEMIENRLSAA